jgi:hypothetical protein
MPIIEPKAYSLGRTRLYLERYDSIGVFSLYCRHCGGAAIRALRAIIGVSPAIAHECRQTRDFRSFR